MARVGKRTLTEFESGERTVYPATINKIKAFYLSQGLAFSAPEDGEGIKFAIVEDSGAQAQTEVREKKEYLDLLGTAKIAHEISEALAIHKYIGEMPSISCIIILEAIKTSGLNQKELSAKMGCTPSFINSIASGKKTLPVKYAGVIQTYFNGREFDVENALHAEKKCGKIASQILSLHHHYLEAWQSVYA